MVGNYWLRDSVKNILYESIYETGCEIGRRPIQPIGSASFTFFCKDKGTGEEWVLKTLQKRITNSTSHRELGNLLRLNHENIVRLKEVFELEDYLQIISEPVYGRTLFRRLAGLNELTEKTMAKYTHQILEGVIYLHENGIVHRNLKPRNILLSDRSADAVVKIADSCFSTIIGMDMELELLCGDSSFCAPEVILGHKFGTSMDMWAVGVLVFLMVCGKEPFLRETEKETFCAILHTDYDFNLITWETVTLQAKDFIRRLLVADSLIRLTAVRALVHPWVTGEGAGDINLPASTYRIGKYIRRQRKKIAKLQNMKSLEASKHLEEVLQKTGCGPVPLRLNNMSQIK